MSGWMAVCKKHFKQVEKDIEKHGNVFLGYCDADRRMRCDVPNCKERADYEIYWGKKDWDISESKFVPYK